MNQPETRGRHHLRWAANTVGICAFWAGFVWLINNPDNHALAAYAAFLIGLWIILGAVERQGYRRGWDDGAADTDREAREELTEAKQLLARSWESDIEAGCQCDWDDHGQGLWHIDRISPDCRMHGREVRFQLDLAAIKAQHIYSIYTLGQGRPIPRGTAT